MQGARHRWKARERAESAPARSRPCPLADALLSTDGHRPQAAECRSRGQWLGKTMTIANLDSAAIGSALDEQGWALLPRLLDAEGCREAAALWRDESRFRSRVT